MKHRQTPTPISPSSPYPPSYTTRRAWRAALHRPGWRGALIGLCCASVAWGLSQHTPLRGLEEWALDGCFVYRGQRPSTAREKIILIGLDDRSLAELGRPLVYASPELAEVVTFLKQQGAAATGVDLIMPETRTPIAGLKGELLGQAVGRAGNVVLAKERTDAGWLLPLDLWQLKRYVHPEPTDLGFADFTEDEDNFLRRQQLYVREGDAAHMQFALALFSVARRTPVEWDPERRELRAGGRRVVLDERQRLRINFVGRRGTFRSLSFRDVLEAARGQAPAPAPLQDAIAIIGVTARGEQDYHATPYANNYFRLSSSLAPQSRGVEGRGPGGRPLTARDPGLMSGAEIHANILATLADGAYIVAPPGLSSLPLLLLFGALLGMLYARLNLQGGFLAMLGFLLGWAGLCFGAFKWANWRVAMVPELLLGFLAYAATFTFRWRWQRQMMGVVKSEPIARALEADPAGLLEGEERLITVLFADIRDFTGFSECRAPRQVVGLLNAYFSAVVPVVEAHGGVVNQYMGDGIMAIFGAPETTPDHAAQAARAAVAMVRRVHELKETWRRAGCPGMRIGVGIHTGRVLVGMVGAPRRLDYTAIGDTVNAAARIEAETKRLGTEILASAATWEALTPAERERLGAAPRPETAQVKGKQEALTLYALGVPTAADRPEPRAHAGGRI
jgi:adenylate cyclase